MLGADLLERLGERVPADHSRQLYAEALIDPSLRALRAQRDDGAGTLRVMDLGCGAGASRAHFMRRAEAIEWVGLDVEGSPERAEHVAARGAGDGMQTFDGREMPFADGHFDLVFCKQVLEHVRAPNDLLGEVARVLAPGGRLCGSVSQLEPYHSLSVGNLTPYGLWLALQDAGLELLEVRPGIDAATLLARRALGMPRFFERWWGRESPGNRALGAAGRALRLSPRELNALKLLFCGQFCFVARA